MFSIMTPAKAPADDNTHNRSADGFGRVVYKCVLQLLKRSPAAFPMCVWA